MLFRILKLVPLASRLQSFELVCRRWLALAHHEDMWHTVVLGTGTHLTTRVCKVLSTARHARQPTPQIELQPLLQAIVTRSTRVAPPITQSRPFSPIKTLDLRSANDFDSFYVELIIALVKEHLPKLQEMFAQCSIDDLIPKWPV